MKFNIIYSNHDNPSVSEPFFMMIRLILESGGHDVRYSDRFETDRINVILENFGPAMRDVCRQAKTNGVRYIIVPTERLTGDTFNSLGDSRMPHYSDASKWASRYQCFLEWADGATALWLATSDPSQCGVYQNATGKPVIELRPAFCEKFKAVEKTDVADIDFFFSGSMTPYRRQMIAQIRSVGVVMDTTAQPPRFVRDEYISRSKFCLDIRLCQSYGQISQMRVWYLLQNNCRVIAEKPSFDAPLAKYAMTFPSDMLVDGCRVALEEFDASDRICRNAIQAFRDETSDKAEAKRLIEETFDNAQAGQ